MTYRHNTSLLSVGSLYRAQNSPVHSFALNVVEEICAYLLLLLFMCLLAYRHKLSVPTILSIGSLCLSQTSPLRSSVLNGVVKIWPYFFHKGSHYDLRCSCYSFWGSQVAF